MTLNTLYYGDNLSVLREFIYDESVDPIYLDPPFNSRQDWGPHPARFWRYGVKDYNVLFAEKVGTCSSSQIMAPHLIELRRVLKATGSIYLHCDPNASHYLKVLMDGVFGPQFFRNEIIWE